MEDQAHPVQAIQQRIAQAAQTAQRNPEDIHLVAVSKRKPIADIVAAYEAGVRDFGENYTDELAEKAQALSHLTDLRWHFIGHLQSRQSLTVAQYAHAFHALDRLKIAERLSSQLGELGRSLPVFIQVNISGEETKSGFECSQWREDATQFTALVKVIKQIAELPNLKIQGLMTMAPFDADEAALHQIFGNLRQLAAQINEQLPQLSLQQLSMGMSQDFEIAIAEGATHVRIGSAIFGARN